MTWFLLLYKPKNCGTTSIRDFFFQTCEVSDILCGFLSILKNIAFKKDTSCRLIGSYWS